MILKQGQGFIPSEKSKYRFFYPHFKQDNEDSWTLLKNDVELTNIPTNIRCPHKFNNLVPYVVSADVAIDHLLKYRIIWVQENTCLK